MLIYLLYSGESCDGAGQGYFLRATESKEDAAEYYRSIKFNPYSIGKVVVLTENFMQTVCFDAEEIKYFGKVIKKGRSK